MKYFDFYGLVMRRKLKIVTLELIYHVNLHYACKCNSVKHIIIVVTMFLSLCKCAHPMCGVIGLLSITSQSMHHSCMMY